MWKEVKDSKGRTYYYDTVSKVSQWERPQELSSGAEKGEKDVERELPSDWRQAKTKEGKVYYYNVTTKKSQWTFPEVKEEKVEKVVKVVKEIVPSSTSPLVGITTTSKEEAEPQFIKMLAEHNVDSTWSFRRIMDEIGTVDPRYWLVDDDPLWKQQMFNKYLSNRTKEQLLREHADISTFQQAFREMLDSKQSIGYTTTWPEAQALIADEPVYSLSVVSEQQKEKCFYEYIHELRSAHDTKLAETKQRALGELRVYLSTIIDSDDTSRMPISWQQLQKVYLFDHNKQYMANENFKVLTHEDVLKEYIAVVDVIQTRIGEALAKARKANYSRDRYARDKYKELLASPRLGIRSNTKWGEVYPLIKGEPAFNALLGRDGSSALDLFLDVVEEKYVVACGLRSVALQALIDSGYEWKETQNREPILELLQNSPQFDKTDPKDLEIVVDLVLSHHEEQLREKEKEAVYRQEQRCNYFKEMLRRFYANPSVAMGEWKTARAQFAQSLEFQELGDDDDTRHKLFEQVKQERKSRKTAQPSRKRPLEPAVSLDY